MKLPLKVVLLVVLSAAQVTAAAWSIVRYEMTLATGSVYKVKTVPVDPADPFRRRYVAIQPALTLPHPLSPEVLSLLDAVGEFRPDTARKTAYAVLGTDSEGFAQVVQVVVLRTCFPGDPLGRRHRDDPDLGLRLGEGALRVEPALDERARVEHRPQLVRPEDVPQELAVERRRHQEKASRSSTPPPEVTTNTFSTRAPQRPAK